MTKYKSGFDYKMTDCKHIGRTTEMDNFLIGFMFVVVISLIFIIGFFVQ